MRCACTLKLIYGKKYSPAAIFDIKAVVENTPYLRSGWIYNRNKCGFCAWNNPNFACYKTAHSFLLCHMSSLQAILFSMTHINKTPKWVMCKMHAVKSLPAHPVRSVIYGYTRSNFLKPNLPMQYLLFRLSFKVFGPLLCSI